jgi:hypothetical protein
VDVKNQQLAPLKEHAGTLRRLVGEAAALREEIATLERRLPPQTTEALSVSAINRCALQRCKTKLRIGWEVAHAAASRRPPVSLSTSVARTEGYTYAAKVRDLLLGQGPFFDSNRALLSLR